MPKQAPAPHEGPEAHRGVARRDAGLEGERDAEPSGALTEDERAMKETQRDLTSLSGPTHRQPDEDQAD